MADNGNAGSVFRNRQGENPFRPVQAPKMRVRTEHSLPQRQVPSYNGMGSNTPNGGTIPRYLNGTAFPSREEPDVRRRADELRKLGKREES